MPTPPAPRSAAIKYGGWEAAPPLWSIPLTGVVSADVEVNIDLEHFHDFCSEEGVSGDEDQFYSYVVSRLNEECELRSLFKIKLTPDQHGFKVVSNRVHPSNGNGKAGTRAVATSCFLTQPD